MNVKAIIRNYRFKPEKGGGVVITTSNGFQSTTIQKVSTITEKYFHKDKSIVEKQVLVNTHNSLYELQDLEPGLWIHNLSLKRPIFYYNLKYLEII